MMIAGIKNGGKKYRPQDKSANKRKEYILQIGIWQLYVQNQTKTRKLGEDNSHPCPDKFRCSSHTLEYYQPGIGDLYALQRPLKKTYST